MKSRLMTFLKTSDFIYFIYFYVFSAIFKILGFFIRTDHNLILFNSFGGKKYDDSPKKIFEAMSCDERCSDFKYVWAFHEPEKMDVKGAKKIKTDNLNYFITALKAGIWVTNSGIERGLNFKKKDTFCINTGHGSPLKTMGSGKIKREHRFEIKYEYNVDLMSAQSRFDIDIFSKCYNLPAEKFILSGLPRNDVLSKQTEEIKRKMKEKLEIPHNKKVILYAPTFREFYRDKKNNCILTAPVNFNKWKEKLGENYYLLFRAHYEISNSINKAIDLSFMRDVSSYHCLNDLMIASDMLVSDYSSIFMDYSILERPMLCFAYDLKEYSDRRGLNIDLYEEFYHEIAETEDELINTIQNIEIEYDKYCERTINFKNKYAESYGRAATIITDKILSVRK